MPEQQLADFTATDELLPSDLLPIQRIVGGARDDYAMTVPGLFGVLMRVQTITYDLDDLLAGFEIINTVTTGTTGFWLVLDAKAVYTPGASQDGDGCFLYLSNGYWSNIGRFTVGPDPLCINIGDDNGSGDYFPVSPFNDVRLSAVKDNTFITPGGTIRITVRYIAAPL